jgi:hypothetical protein
MAAVKRSAKVVHSVHVHTTAMKGGNAMETSARVEAAATMEAATAAAGFRRDRLRHGENQRQYGRRSPKPHAILDFHFACSINPTAGRPVQAI